LAVLLEYINTKSCIYIMITANHEIVSTSVLGVITTRDRDGVDILCDGNFRVHVKYIDQIQVKII